MKDLVVKDNKESFINGLNSNIDCGITADGHLLVWDPMGDTPWNCSHEDKPELKMEFNLSLGLPIQTLKEFMAKHYGHVDVDVAFETWKPGVFERFSNSMADAYHEFQGYQQEKMFELLVTTLKNNGYEVTFLV
jgi:hypothetical protein